MENHHFSWENPEGNPQKKRAASLASSKLPDQQLEFLQRAVLPADLWLWPDFCGCLLVAIMEKHG